MDTAPHDIGSHSEPLLIFGGPYSNLAATAAMRTEAERRAIPPERIICTGDLVAYCAHPQETVDLVRDWGIHVIMGNCEESIAKGATDCGCGFAAGTSCSLLSVEWYNYAAKRIDDATRRWFASLPKALRLNFHGLALQVCHATPHSINQFVFASSDPQQKEHSLRQLGCDLLIAGHCGIPFGQKLPAGSWLNAGVIGMPANDGTPDGWYMLLQQSASGCRVTWHRLGYAAAQSAAEMQSAGLTAGYAETISSGLWPSEDVLPAAERSARGQALQLAPLSLSRPRLR